MSNWVDAPRHAGRQLIGDRVKEEFDQDLSKETPSVYIKSAGKPLF